jgi:peptidyl-prolyl cis-trans isomerase SurA
MRVAPRLRILLSFGLTAGALLAAPADGVLLAPSARAQTVQSIAAVVNDDIVSTQELDNRVRLALATSNLPNDAEMQRRLSQQVLRAMIDEKLQRQEAQRLSISITDDEIDNALRSLAERNNISIGQLEQFLVERGSSMAALRAQVAAQITWLKLVAREIRPRVSVTEEQVDYALKNAPVVAGERDLLLSEILLPVYNPDQEPQVMRDALDLVQTLRTGGDFAALARQVSVSASAEGGGDLGWIPTSALSEELRTALQTVQAGQISDPIRTANGVQLFLVRDARASEGAPPAPTESDAQARDNARRRLLEEQTQRLANRYLRDLRLNAFIDIRT